MRRFELGSCGVAIQRYAAGAQMTAETAGRGGAVHRPEAAGCLAQRQCFQGGVSESSCLISTGSDAVTDPSQMSYLQEIIERGFQALPDLLAGSGETE